MKKALEHLSQDPVMKKLIDFHPVPTWEKKKDLFRSLIYEIIGQQLSGKVARVIFQRIVDLVGGRRNLRPEDILKLSDESIRSAGSSWAKVKYIKSLAGAVSKNRLDLKNLERFSDEEVYRQLTAIKGIGPWTTAMFLIFTLHRPDVFSVGDLGLRTAVSRLYKVRRDNLKKIEKISQAWKPYRSFASRYLWSSLENE